MAKMLKKMLVLVDGERMSMCHQLKDLEIVKSRVGFVCRVVESVGVAKSNHSHIYFDDTLDEGPCYFYCGGSWWISYIPIKKHLDVEVDDKRQALTVQLDCLNSTRSRLEASVVEHRNTLLELSTKIQNLDERMASISVELGRYGLD